MIEIAATLNGFRLNILAQVFAALEALVAEASIDFLAVNLVPTGEIHIQAALLGSFSMLVCCACWVLQIVVYSFAQTTLALTSRLPCRMSVEQVERLECVADDAVLEVLSFVDVFIVQDGKGAFLDDRVISEVAKFVIVEARFLAEFVYVTTRWAGDLKEFADVVLADENVNLTVGMQALKSLEHYVPHVLDMGGAHLIGLFDSCVCPTSCHV